MGTPVVSYAPRPISQAVEFLDGDIMDDLTRGCQKGGFICDKLGVTEAIYFPTPELRSAVTYVVRLCCREGRRGGRPTASQVDSSVLVTQTDLGDLDLDLKFFCALAREECCGSEGGRGGPREFEKLPAVRASCFFLYCVFGSGNGVNTA